MRVKRSLINSIVGIAMYIASFLPMFIVRKIFLDILGSELLGLSSLYTNIISYLSIVEMGIGTAIIFSLYKPFANKDFSKVKGYLDYYKKFYNNVGKIILVLGLILIPFLQYFIKDNINMTQARICFLLFLINTVISYFFSYKQCLLNVAQEGYKISIATTISKIFISIVQVIVLSCFRSFYLYIIVQIIFNLICYLIIDNYIKKRFEIIINQKGDLDNNERRDLNKNVKALFLHKIGMVFVFGTDNLVLSTFVSLKAVTKYNNYYMITSTLSGVISNGIKSITPSIGNLLAEEDTKNSYNIHKKLFFLNFWLVSFLVISLFNTLTQFIVIWLGPNQKLNEFTVSLILFNLYFQLMRISVEQFKEASGEYHQDRFAPVFEGIINLTSSIIFVKYIGIAGVLLGTLISNLTVIFWVKPKIVYKYVFKKPLRKYFAMYFKYMFIGLIPLIITNFLTKNIRESTDIRVFILNCIINVIMINIIYLILFWKNEEFKYYKNILINMINKLIKN